MGRLLADSAGRLPGRLLRRVVARASWPGRTRGAQRGEVRRTGAHRADRRFWRARAFPARPLGLGLVPAGGGCRLSGRRRRGGLLPPLSGARTGSRRARWRLPGSRAGGRVPAIPRGAARRPRLVPPAGNARARTAARETGAAAARAVPGRTLLRRALLGE